MDIILAIIILGTFGYLVVRFAGTIVEIFIAYRDFSKTYVSKKKVVSPRPPQFRSPVVANHLGKFPYYNALSLNGKIKFAQRSTLFIEDKEIVGHEGLAVTDEMRVYISAAATQVTFGLDRHLLEHFHTVRIYPETFFSRLADAHLKGGSTTGGVMMFSWKDFQEGYEVHDDKLNLGLHEMGHALLVDMMYGTSPDEHFMSHIGRWERAGDRVLNEMRAKRSNFLRAYGATNEQEFFAVCVEHFFESPAQFRERLPDVYFAMCRLLNQDPLNVTQDYRFY